jgi:DDHD domain
MDCNPEERRGPAVLSLDVGASDHCESIASSFLLSAPQSHDGPAGGAIATTGAPMRRSSLSGSSLSLSGSSSEFIVGGRSSNIYNGIFPADEDPVARAAAAGSDSSMSSHPDSDNGDDEDYEMQGLRASVSPYAYAEGAAPDLPSPIAASYNDRAHEAERGSVMPSRSHESSSARKSRHKSHPSHTFRRVQRVSRHAALATKQQLWDSNAASIDAALSAVNQWEAGYVALRGLVMGGAQNVGNFYGAAKAQAANLEHGILRPIRDWILLPALFGVERAVAETANLAQQHRGTALEGTQRLARAVPFVGENLLAPSLFWSVELAKRTWDLIQYPIPSKQQVVSTVDTALTGTKWALSAAARESLLYMKRADAILTRTLSTTQWKVLGKGPYATLDEASKGEVIDHVCDRYLSMSRDGLGRYELVAHIRLHNPSLYQDLVLTGVLQRRGGALAADDEWLSTCPVYRNLAAPFLLEPSSPSPEGEHDDGQREFPLWFRLPNVNGKRPPKDAPWIPLRRSDARNLEERFVHLVNEGWRESLHEAADGGGCLLPELIDDSRPTTSFRAPYPTVAEFYDPHMEQDILVEQKRAAVSFQFVCSKCRDPLAAKSPPPTQRDQIVMKRDVVCHACLSSFSSSLASAVSSFASLGPPQIAMTLRPTFWRFHGAGDPVRRATWLLDTARYGLQPFDDEASGILEDAYLFLKWMSLQRAFQVDECDSQADDAILTVEVPGPDGQDRLVQFTSLTRATAIQKGLGSAVALFKRRVYRGACLNAEPFNPKLRDEIAPLEMSYLQAVEAHGTLGDTPVPDTSIRAALELKAAPRRHVNPISSLAVQPEELDEKMGDSLDDEEDGEIGHLVLVVHGIGEMLRTIDLFGLSIPNLASIVDCCAFLRKNHSEVQDAHFSRMYPSEDVLSAGRVEYLPIEWHEAFTILSQRRPDPSSSSPESIRSRSVIRPGASDEPHRKKSVLHGHDIMVKDISLRTIPNMREFANDTLLDVLYFMSPEHHDVILGIVTSEMNAIVDRFRCLASYSGRVSIVGHSLGSIIVWDILSNQSDPGQSTGIRSVPSQPIFDSSAAFLTPSTKRSFLYGYAPESTARKEDCSRSISLPNPSHVCHNLEFKVDNFFLLGSPVAVFLMIRNQRRPLSEDFALPSCSRVFNIYHPFDIIAYRIEPCIDPGNANFEPTIMPHWNGGFRVHYQTKRLWRKFVDTTWKTQQNVVEAFEARMAAMGLIDSEANNLFDDDVSSSDQSSDSRAHRVTTGALNQGRRIDYMLQEKEIENANEYVAALAAHSSYWTEKDLSLFISRQICLSKYASDVETSWLWDQSESDSRS